MATLVAIDLAILPPPDVTARAIEYSAALAADGPALSERLSAGWERVEGLRLDAEHLPHLTLTQQFISEDELDAAYSCVNEVLANQPPIGVPITGGGRRGHTLWLAAQRAPELVDLHERLMEALRGLERPEGGAHSFFEGHARPGDVLWVAGFRRKSSFGAFNPHITLGHGKRAPAVDPFAFEATTIAACHLGKFCTCRKVLRSWTLALPCVDTLSGPFL